MFKILVRLGCFLPTKKQNNAACSAEKSASKVHDSWIKIDFGLALHSTNHAYLCKTMQTQESKQQFLESCTQIYCAASAEFKLKAMCIK